MSLTIGRAVLNAPMTVSQSGDSVSFSLSIDSSWLTGGVAQAKALWQQITGLANNPDEPVIPVAWSDNPAMDGWYRVSSASVEPYVTFLLNGTMRAQVQLERLKGGWAKPTIDTMWRYAVRTNTKGIVSVTGSPIQAVTDDNTLESSSTFAAAYTTATGGIRVYSGSVANNGVYSQSAGPNSLSQPGSCLLEIDYTGSGAWYPVIGSQISMPVGRNWRISNGLVRVSLSTASAGRLQVEIWTGSWEALPLLRRWNSTATYFGLLTATDTASRVLEPIVLRNSPDCVVVAMESMKEMFTLQRGIPYVSIFTPLGRVAFDSVTACTNITETDVHGAGSDICGIYSNAATLGNTTVIVNPLGILGAANTTTDTTNGTVTGGSITGGTEGYTTYVGGFGTGAIVTTRADLVRNMFLATSNKTMVVTR